MKKNIAVYPGTFDPITNGHLDILERACSLFDKVIITIALNTKKIPLFTKEERIDMIYNSMKKYSNIKIDAFDGLLVDYAINVKANAIIRGLRALSDFEYEFQLALTNRKLAPKINTIFLMPNEKYTYLNSSIVKELSKFGGDVSCFVSKYVEKKLRGKFGL